MHRYLTARVLASLALTVAVFTFVLLLGNALKEILALLIAGEVGIGIVARAVGMLIPFVLVFALPMGLLTATLLVFGRFSADQELTAARASGISLVSLAAPIVVLSLLCCGLSAWINMEWGPDSRVAYKELIGRARTDLSRIQLPAGRLIYDFPGYVFRVGGNRNGDLENVVVYWLALKTYIQAPRGHIQMDVTNHEMTVELFDAQSVTRTTNGVPSFSSFPTLLLPVQWKAAPANGRPAVNDMTFGQLQRELRRREALAAMAPAGTNFAASAKAGRALVEEARVAMNREGAFSFACFGFALMGIALGVRMHRRETNIGVAVALGLVLLYYGFFTLAGSLAPRPEFYPHLIAWAPDFIFQATGAVLLWRANRGL
ncbi:MAG: LptF/LptG family permease [Verrucomicrobia bacterium]|nr:LptF/LptG family permease [Verrucomicrobiota bacterium]MDE3099235.1 LptF/LptG family permease [Verrucomicrobiota bacterium]